MSHFVAATAMRTDERWGFKFLPRQWLAAAQIKSWMSARWAEQKAAAKKGEEATAAFLQKHTTAIVYKFSGGLETGLGYAFDDKFDELLVVPDEVLKGVRNESAPGSFFSGQPKSRNINQWNPAPEGKVWFKHPFIKEPTGFTKVGH